MSDSQSGKHGRQPSGEQSAQNSPKPPPAKRIETFHAQRVLRKRDGQERVVDMILPVNPSLSKESKPRPSRSRPQAPAGQESSPASQSEAGSVVDNRATVDMITSSLSRVSFPFQFHLLILSFTPQVLTIFLRLFLVAISKN
jgi:hypothetical protein